MPTSKLRIVHLAGPGDAPAVLRSIAAGKAFDGVAHVAYSGLVFDTCRKLGAALLSISTHGRSDDFSFDNLRALNIEDPLKGKNGLSYHLAQLAYARAVREHVREFNADVLINAPDPYPFLVAGLASEGVRFVPALHATLLPVFKRPSRTRRLAVRLSRRFYSRTCVAILSHPGATVRQMFELGGGRLRPIVEFLPLMRSDAFPGIQRPRLDSKVFRVMTVGRVEADKGAFALLEIARRCREKLGDRVTFDVCGAGSALDEARRRAVEMGLQETVKYHGWTSMEDLARLWGESHVAVVPTTSDFVEGFNQVVIEAAMAGRPVITSRVCPSLEYVRPCAVEVEVDDLEAYAAEIVRLAGDRESYAKLQRATDDVVKPFFDPGKSFGAAVEYVLRSIIDGREVSPISHPPEISRGR